MSCYIFQLSDVEVGGSTVFPELGIAVSPVKVCTLLIKSEILFNYDGFFTAYLLKKIQTSGHNFVPRCCIVEYHLTLPIFFTPGCTRGSYTLLPFVPVFGYYPRPCPAVLFLSLPSFSKLCLVFRLSVFLLVTVSALSFNSPI